MERSAAVYILDKIVDDPRYEGFVCENDDLFPRFRMDDPQVPRVTGVWKPSGIAGRVRPFNYFPCLLPIPAFSQRAVDALQDMLEPNGELIPFDAPAGRYYAYNTTTLSDALDEGRSTIKAFRSDPRKILDIPRYEFIADEVNDLTIFRIRQRPHYTFVTDAFVTLAREHGLKGFAFKKVWPMPTGVEWRSLYAEERRQQYREGLPSGQTVTGNSVRIELSLKGENPTEEERQKIDELGIELDDIFIDMTSAAPQVGNLDAIQFFERRCDLILSGPSADAMVEKLRPWLDRLTWSAGLRVVKRYGYAVEKDAPEEDVPVETR